MANPEQVALLREGVDAWNQWRRKNPSANLDLFRANLTDAILAGADLSSGAVPRPNPPGPNLAPTDRRSTILIQASLQGANLSGANLSGAVLGMAWLPKADLSGANLALADLSGADLRGVDFSRANLFEANLSRAILSESILDKAQLNSTVLAGVDLSSVKGLASAHHFGPSSIGIDTLVRSKGAIPEVFLRGAGVPEPFITNMKSLISAMSPIQFYSCFISYSTKDQEFGDRLYADLQARGIRCWFAPHDVQAGRKLHEQIDEAIRLHDKLLIILSEASMSSEWVKTEISKARKREARDGARVLFPISLARFEALRDWDCFDADAGKDSAREIREYYIPDFSNWKDHDDYQKAFQRLVKDLQATGEGVRR